MKYKDITDKRKDSENALRAFFWSGRLQTGFTRVQWGKWLRAPEGVQEDYRQVMKLPFLTKPLQEKFNVE